MTKLILTLLFPISIFAQEYKIDKNKLCDGYPQVSVSSIENSCVGLVATAALKDATGQSFKFPRKIIEFKPNMFLITDMGGWSPYSGKVWLLDLNRKTLKAILQNLTLPHGIAIGPDGMVYIGEMGLIFKFNPAAANPSLTCQTVIKDLPSMVKRTSGNPCTDEKPTASTSVISHPLVSFTFSKNPSNLWNLIVNTGSASDNCTDKQKNKKVDSKGRCLESDGSNPSASVKEFRYLGNGSWDSNFKLLARGLRNSMVLISHESGNIIQMENSMDFPEASEPFEEINVLKEGKHYGWPYCFNFKGQNPLFNAFACNERNSYYEPPYALVPPHTAPLDGLYYEGSMFQELQNTIVVSWHGYRDAGQRIVSYPTNTDGLPYVTQDSFYYNSFENNKTTRVKANPKGGLLRTAPYNEVVFDWYAVKDLRPRGAPVGLAVAHDGSIFVIEDKNKTILRISRGNSSKENGSQNQTQLNEKLLTADLLAKWSKISKNVLQPQCAACHVQVHNKNDKENLKNLVSMGWIIPGNGKDSLMVKRMKGGDMRLMPPSGSLPPNEIQAVEQFIQDLH